MSIVCRFVAVATVSFSSALAAQRTGPCPPVQGSVFLDCQTDQPPLSLGEAQVPTYPSILAQAGVSGSARIRYLIDTTGRVSTASYEVIRASHELLASEVRRSVLGWRFAPALRGGQPVVVRREQEFVFLLPPDGVPTDAHRPARPAGLGSVRPRGRPLLRVSARGRAGRGLGRPLSRHPRRSSAGASARRSSSPTR